MENLRLELVPRSHALPIQLDQCIPTVHDLPWPLSHKISATTTCCCTVFSHFTSTLQNHLTELVWVNNVPSQIYSHTQSNPDSKVHGANVGPIWGRQDPGGPHVGSMNFAIWEGLMEQKRLMLAVQNKTKHSHTMPPHLTSLPNHSTIQTDYATNRLLKL